MRLTQAEVDTKAQEVSSVFSNRPENNETTLELWLLTQVALTFYETIEDIKSANTLLQSAYQKNFTNLTQEETALIHSLPDNALSSTVNELKRTNHW
ncbi:hypothetical protein LRY65_00625 [Candidatus Woesebacteria bacterium]|nr:hypothetical protein [Candidatus Woesebacteria bacterium]MCD8507221.1 hypothetical protein [Candidatus Woesebacteria bacterium]MCD8526703.1 hypothetical protein [Candidatus Woesebacteria bacterium]MCD8546553.1 hypothetical protein [Candidatus Woesebacteria bacterium]